jgi:hypothetical protein
MRERGVYLLCKVRMGRCDRNGRSEDGHEEQLFSLCPLLWCYLVALAEIKCQYVLDFD